MITLGKTPLYSVVKKTNTSKVTAKVYTAQSLPEFVLLPPCNSGENSLILCGKKYRYIEGYRRDLRVRLPEFVGTPGNSYSLELCGKKYRYRRLSQRFESTAQCLPEFVGLRVTLGKTPLYSVVKKASLRYPLPYSDRRGLSTTEIICQSDYIIFITGVIGIGMLPDLSHDAMFIQSDEPMAFALCEDHLIFQF